MNPEVLAYDLSGDLIAGKMSYGYALGKLIANIPVCSECTILRAVGEGSHYRCNNCVISANNYLTRAIERRKNHECRD